MQKIIHTISALTCSLLFLSLSMLQSAYGYTYAYHGTCGAPPTEPNKDFCSCFLKESAKTCREASSSYHVPLAFCTEEFIASNTKHIKDPQRLCEQYRYMRPVDVTIQECSEDMIYFKNNC